MLQARKRLFTQVAATRIPDERLRPIVRYYEDREWAEPWSVYHLPMRLAQPDAKRKILSFLDLLLSAVGETASLKTYTFFEQSYLHPNLAAKFVLRAADFSPTPAVGVRPELGHPRFPTQTDVEGIDPERAANIIDEHKPNLTFEDFFPQMPALVYRIQGDPALARTELFGEGGWSCILSSLDEKTFWEKSKAAMIAGSADEAMQAIPAIAPLLRLASFLDCPEGRLAEWFEIFDFYLAECPTEGGLVIASRTCLDELLAELVAESGLGPRKRQFE